MIEKDLKGRRKIEIIWMIERLKENNTKFTKWSRYKSKTTNKQIQKSEDSQPGTL